MSTESGIPDFRSCERDLGGGRPVRGRIDRRLPPRSASRVALVRATDRRPPRGGAERRATSRSRRSSGRATSRTIVTQNIDLLHARAGSGDVIEVHGSIARFPCLACAGEETLEGVLEQLADRDAPLCRRCGDDREAGRRHVRRASAGEAMARADLLVRETGLLLVVGSSLQVWPVAGLPADTVRAGGALGIVNLEETPYDADASVVVRGPSGAVLGEVARDARCLRPSSRVHPGRRCAPRWPEGVR